MEKLAKFLVPAETTELALGQIAKPICAKANYICQLARREKLSLKELYLVQKIGFAIQILYEHSIE